MGGDVSLSVASIPLDLPTSSAVLSESRVSDLAVSLPLPSSTVTPTVPLATLPFDTVVCWSTVPSTSIVGAGFPKVSSNFDPPRGSSAVSVAGAGMESGLLSPRIAAALQYVADYHARQPTTDGIPATVAAAMKSPTTDGDMKSPTTDGILSTVAAVKSPTVDGMKSPTADGNPATVAAAMKSPTPTADSMKIPTVDGNPAMVAAAMKSPTADGIPATVAATMKSPIAGAGGNVLRKVAPSFADIAARRAAKPPDLFAYNNTTFSPIKQDDGFAVFIPDVLYEQQLRLFQFSLIGRLMLPQGAKPRSTTDIKGELTKVFTTVADWKLVPLGKGFFSLNFSTKDDQIKASRLSSWKLSTGFMQIRDWKPNFDPYKESSSSAQIWVRLFHLPVEYWHTDYLIGIFRAVGNVIKLDGNTAHGVVGHFARALVEVDLSRPLLTTVKVGLAHDPFHIDISYENIPLLCTFCHFVGHSVDKCRKAKAAAPNENKAVDDPPRDPPRKIWKAKDKTAVDNQPPAQLHSATNTEEQRSLTLQRPLGPNDAAPSFHPSSPAADIEGVQLHNSYAALGHVSDTDDDKEESDFALLHSLIMVPEGQPLTEEQRAVKNRLIKGAQRFKKERLTRLQSAHTSPVSSQSTSVPETQPEKEKSAFVPESQTTHDSSLSSGQSVQPVSQFTSHADLANMKKGFARAKTAKSSLKPLRSSSVSPQSSYLAGGHVEQVPSTSIGQPKSTTAAPNSPHPSRNMEDRLRHMQELGRNPTAFDHDPGDDEAARLMDNVVHNRWSDVVQDAPSESSDSDKADPTLSDSLSASL